MIDISLQKKLVMPDGAGKLSIETTIEAGSFTAIFGKSGVGKTSFLRMIAGLLKPDEGMIKVNDTFWLNTDETIDLPVQKREIGFVFQEPALFPNMSVMGNLRYAAGKRTNESFLDDLLQIVGLESFADRKPATLSGGQQQRIAMIRALARKPKLLLLDEPFAALDAEMRHHLKKELFLLHKEFNLTTILVTHDLSDIFSLADKVIVIDQGTVMKSGNPDEVFGSSQIHGKVRLQGEILRIKKSGVVFIAEILAGNNIISLIIGEEERTNLEPGAKVLVCSGSFEPVIEVLA
jgi:molybdate transport system ATP-binding protein